MSKLRYARQTTLPAIGAEGQARLGDSSVLIIGAGGLGTPASLYLAGSGVGQILINDFDSIDETNLPRQILYGDSDVGSFKAPVAAEKLMAANPNVDVVALDEKLTREVMAECVTSVDAVLDCSDSFTTRWLVNEVCMEADTPLISGAAIRWEGQVAVFMPGGKPCYRCLYQEEDENLNDCAGQGIVAPVAGTVGTMMATEAIKVLLSVDSGLQGRLWVYDGLAGSSRTVGIPALPDCPTCSKV